MKKNISLLLGLLLMLSLTISAAADTEVEPVEIAAVYAQQEKQPFTAEDGSIEFLDTIWFYLNDGNFVQYAFLDDEPVVFSTGTYSLRNGGSFVPADDGGNNGDLVIRRKAKYAAGEGLAEYSSKHSYSMDKLGFQQLFYAGDKGKRIEAVFAGCEKQPFGEDRMLDTYWFYYSDGSFEQYACIGSDPILFSEGTYSLSEGANFLYVENETDCGTITITRTMKFQEGLNYAEYDSEHTYDLNSLGFARLSPVQYILSGVNAQ